MVTWECGIGGAQGARHRGDEPGQAGLVRVALAFEVEVHPIEVLGRDGGHQRVGERRGGGR